MSAYYNEHDPKAAAWLRELIKQGHIADGVVDERSIEDVLPNEIREFTQCHFFAGIGVWSYALRRAGWSDDRRVWTMSCPCQPFSAAGEGAGFADERHLWPAGHYLIGQCKPDVVFGEQVASKGADTWIDLVHTDMEALGYAFGAVPFPSAGVGAPHIRDRTYWVADSNPTVGRTNIPRRDDVYRENTGRTQSASYVEGCGCTSGMADMQRAGSQGRVSGGQDSERSDQYGHTGRDGAAGDTRTVDSFWRDADWLFCRDEKLRPVEPGTFPLADGAPARMGRLRGYGNAINAEAAKAFIGSYLG